MSFSLLNNLRVKELFSEKEVSKNTYEKRSLFSFCQCKNNVRQRHSNNHVINCLKILCWISRSSVRRCQKACGFESHCKMFHRIFAKWQIHPNFLFTNWFNAHTVLRTDRRTDGVILVIFLPQNDNMISLDVLHADRDSSINQEDMGQRKLTNIHGYSFWCRQGRTILMDEGVFRNTKHVMNFFITKVSDTEIWIPCRVC